MKTLIIELLNYIRQLPLKSKHYIKHESNIFIIYN